MKHEGNIMTGYPMTVVMSVLMAILLGSFIATCGSDSDVATSNHLFDGVYHFNVMKHDETADPPVANYTVIANGDGTASLPGLADITYTVYSDRSITIVLGAPNENVYGKISGNGDILALTDAVYGSSQDVELAIGVRNSSDNVLADLAGDFMIYQAGVKDTGEFYTTHVSATIDAVGSGQWEILSHSLDGPGNTGTVTATMNGDGTFTANNGFADDFGIISPDGNLFVIADSDTGDGDNEMILSVGIRNSTSAPDVTGEFLINQVALANSVAEEYTARVSVVMGASDYSFNILAHSLGATGTQSGIPYTVYSDGTADIGSSVEAQATQDGSILAIVGTDNITNDELVFGIGIR